MPRRFYPCRACQDRHAKCDSLKPKCSHCQKSGRDCIRFAERIKFKNHSSGSSGRDFPQRQIWMNSVSKDFLDETATIRAKHGQDASSIRQGSTPSIFRGGEDLPSSSPSTADGTPDSHEVIDATDDRVSPSSAHSVNLVSTTVQPQLQYANSLLGPGHFHQRAISHEAFSPFPTALSRHGTASASLSSHESSHPFPSLWAPRWTIWNGLNAEQACLLRYFVEELAKWFDLCDPDRHFSTVVPQRAASCSPLLNAIFSASARHLSTLTGSRQQDTFAYYGFPHLTRMFEDTALQYHSQCIADLRQLSDDPESLMNEDLLAAVVILRFYEEIDAPVMGHEQDTALRGLQMFIEAQSDTALSVVGLRQAAFWVGFRQEIHMAFLQQRPFTLPLDICQRYRSWESAPDHVWANRLMIHCADVLQYCFGDCQPPSPPSVQRHAKLMEFSRRWSEYHPPSFAPIYHREANGTTAAEDLLPRFLYIADCHVVGNQNLALTMILLTVFDPQIPRLGLDHRKALRSVEEKVKKMLFRICGTAVSNRQTPPAFLAAAIAINMCGDQVIDPEERRVVLDVLIETEQNNAWPTAAIQTKLKEAWGWL